VAATNRLRYNGLLCGTATPTLAASISSGGTTVTFPAALKYQGTTAVPTIADPDYLPLVINPDTSAMEIVWLVAYTAGATSGTILRHQEDTAANAHGAGSAISHGPTALDFAGGGGGVTPGDRAHIETDAAGPVTVAAGGHAGIYPLLDNVTLAAAWLDPVTGGHLTFTEDGNYFIAVDIDVNFATPPTTGYVTPYFSDSMSDSPFLIGHTDLGLLLAGGDPTFSQIAYYEAGTSIQTWLENKTDQSLDVVWARIYILKVG
jgi:hypothetical protein